MIYFIYCDPLRHLWPKEPSDIPSPLPTLALRCCLLKRRHVGNKTQKWPSLPLVREVKQIEVKMRFSPVWGGRVPDRDLSSAAAVLRAEGNPGNPAKPSLGGCVPAETFELEKVFHNTVSGKVLGDSYQRWKAPSRVLPHLSRCFHPFRFPECWRTGYVNPGNGHGWEALKS